MSSVVDEEIDDFGELIESSLSRKRTPLTKLSVLIGQKHLNFKIVDKNIAKEKESCSKQPSIDKSSAKSSNKRRPIRSKVSFVDQDEDYEEEYESPPIKRRPVPRKRGAISNYYTTPPPAQTYLTSLAYDSAARSNPNNGEILPMPPPPAPSTRASDDAEFNCMFCGCCFESADDLTEHEPLCAAGETESMNISCHCGRTFINIDALDSHSSELMLHERIHGEEETEFNCSVCGKSFTSRMKLSRHEVMHSASGQKPFSCTYCGKTFAHHQSLQKHERGHTGEKPFQCPICTKCFAAQSNYDVHMKLHASGRRFFCSFCGKWFRTEHQMLEHQQNCLAHLHGQNTGDGKPLRYQCSFCEKMFHYRRDQANGPICVKFAVAISVTGKFITFILISSLRKHEFIRHPSINPHFVGAMPLQRPLFISQEDDDQGDQIDITAINF
uniref:C2H2-type domain-containing protein n=1 Tax=Romanomermis culicivorax TaxID=13658 RepID=A0A915KTA5_ROMCU